MEPFANDHLHARQVEVAMQRGVGAALDRVVRPQHLLTVRHRDRVVCWLMPWMRAGKRLWPGGCQSCVAKAWSKPASRRLITGTTASPSVTASSPPGMNVGCTVHRPGYAVASVDHRPSCSKRSLNFGEGESVATSGLQCHCEEAQRQKQIAGRVGARTSPTELASSASPPRNDIQANCEITFSPTISIERMI